MTHDLTDLVLQYLQATSLADSGEDPFGEAQEEMVSQIMSAHINIDDGDTLVVTLDGREYEAVVAHPDNNEDLFNFVLAAGVQMDIFDWIDSIV